MKTIPRPEYPRPQAVRKEWINLNGEWDFCIDQGRSGEERLLYNVDASFDMSITVPFCPESILSGVHNKDFMHCVWYKKEITIEDSWLKSQRRTILHIGACDYHTKLWVNGEYVAEHFGGYISFSFDITKHLKQGTNVITICAMDDVRSQTQPGGKQSKLYNSYGCWYTRTTGIWQTVWMENLPSSYIKEFKITPNIHDSSVLIEFECIQAHKKTIQLKALLNKEQIAEAESFVDGNSASCVMKIEDPVLWSVDNPQLYDLEIKMGQDEISSYFGMRSISYNEGVFYLNGQALFQRLVLDQGFYPDGIYTAPTDEALKQDILLSKDMGFNGARLHEKIFEPRFLYHCDKLGYLVWAEHANWSLDLSRDSAWQGFAPEWLEILKRDYNHPSIIGWCPFNETRKEQNEQLILFISQLTHAYDPYRPFIDTSGYVHVAGATQIYDQHNYEQDTQKFIDKYYDKENFDACPFVSEYGGIWWSEEDMSGWGYGNRPASMQEFIERYRILTHALLDHPKMGAFCYTQLYDVEQEHNGLYTYDRKPKLDPAIIREINSKKAAIELK